MAALALIGGAVFAGILFGCVALDLSFVTAAFVLLIAVMLLSLLESFVLAVCFSVVAVGCLDFFFVEPRGTFIVGNDHDIAALAAFLATSLTVTTLIGRVRGLGEARRRQAGLLDRTAGSEARLRAAIDTVPAIVWSTQADGGNDFQNQRLLSYAGYAAEQAVGMGWLAMIHPDDVQRHAAAWQDAVANGTSFECESRLRRFDGEYRWFLARAEPLRDERGTIVKWYGTNIDIHDRRLAEQALRDSEQRYRDVVRYMPIGLVQVDVSGLLKIVQGLRDEGVEDLGAYMDAHPDFIRRATDGFIVEAANDHTLRMFGARDVSEMTGPATRYWGASFDTARRLIEGRFRGEEVFYEETKLTTLDGRVIDVVFAAARPSALADKSLVGLIDITERVRAQDMLNRVQADFAHAARVAMLGELTASIAHEVNQPLAAIVANAGAGLRWLDRDPPDLAELREVTESIVADARRAADIIGRVRAMAARQATERAPLLLDEVIREALLFLQREIQMRGVTVAHRAAAAAVMVRADRTQLQQVIVNLAVNAMQAMMQAGTGERRIVIGTTLASTDAVLCTVEDSGPGIDPADADRLFDSFFTTREGGMGMGLRICRSIVEAHGGTITADNGSSEGGARFSFTLPVAPGMP